MLTELLYFINVYDLTNETKYNASDGRQMTEFNEKTYPKRKEKLLKLFATPSGPYLRISSRTIYTFN